MFSRNQPPRPPELADLHIRLGIECTCGWKPDVVVPGVEKPTLQIITDYVSPQLDAHALAHWQMVNPPSA